MSAAACWCWPKAHGRPGEDALCRPFRGPSRRTRRSRHRRHLQRGPRSRGSSPGVTSRARSSCSMGAGANGSTRPGIDRRPGFSSTRWRTRRTDRCGLRRCGGEPTAGAHRDGHPPGDGGRLRRAMQELLRPDARRYSGMPTTAAGGARAAPGESRAVARRSDVNVGHGHRQQDRLMPRGFGSACYDHCGTSTRSKTPSTSPRRRRAAVSPGARAVGLSGRGAVS